MGAGNKADDRGLVSRVGPVKINWPQSIGFFGGIAVAVYFEMIPPPFAIFVASAPFLKLIKGPWAPMPVRIVAGTLEGAAKPVGGDAEQTIRMAKAREPE